MSKALLLFVIVGLALEAQAPLDPGALYKQASPTVVLIEAIGSDGKVVKTGSGLIVSADGRLLSNYHVISHVKQATVRLTNGDAYDIVEVIAVDKRKDLVLLKIPAFDLSPATLGRSNSVAVGQGVYSISSPLGLQNTLSQGLVSGIREMDGYRLFQVSAPISHGSSGGPIYNAIGEVIGIAVLSIQEGQNLNFAIPIDYARGMLGLSQTQPLASIYEPEPPTEVQPSAPKLDPQNSRPIVPEGLRKEGLVFLAKQFGAWNLDDAKAVFGEPARQRDALVGSQVDGTIFAFPDPTGGMREFELNFGKATGRLRAVYAFPHKFSLKEAQSNWGRNYKETKLPNGNRTFAYVDKRIFLVVGPKGDVISIGVYQP